MKSVNGMKVKLKQYSIVVLGIFLVALAFNLFLSPNNLVAGGISGLAIIIRKIFGINEVSFIFVANVFLLLVSFRYLGKEKTKNTLLGSLLFPVFVSLTTGVTKIYNSSFLDPLIIAILGGCVSGLGYGLVFQNNFTTGGTDILNQVMEKYMKIPMTKSILYIDGPIVLLGCITFGIEGMLYSLIVLYLVSTLSNTTMLSLNKNRVLYIQTTEDEKIKRYLEETFCYDMTILNVIGGYSKKEQKMIMCSVENNKYYQIKNEILYLDPNAFITVATSYEQKNANKTIRNLTLEQKEC